jgi:site-specific recombinase XerD
MLLHHLIVAYGEALGDSRLSLTTQRTYQNRARSFLRFLRSRMSEEPTAADVTSHEVRAYLADAKTRVAPATTYQYHVQMIAFCRYLYETGYTARCVTDALPKPEPAQNRRLLPAAAHVAELEKAPDRFSTERKRCMARAIFSLLRYCGLRPCEVRNLRIDDFDPEQRTLAINYSKGGKSRVAYPPAKVCKDLDAWLKVRPKCVHSYLFGSAINKRLGESSLPELFREMLRLVGLHGMRGLTPHSMRHVFASQLIADGTDLNTVKELLGHADLSAVQIYAHSTPERMRDATERAARQKESGTVPPSPPQNHRPVNWL